MQVVGAGALNQAIKAGGSSLRDHRQTSGELGYFQHSFEQMMRAGGFRPIVFLYHGLWVAFLTATAVLAAFTLAPDWVCEVLSPSTEMIDRGKKLGLYARAEVALGVLPTLIGASLAASFALRGSRAVGGAGIVSGMSPQGGFDGRGDDRRAHQRMPELHRPDVELHDPGLRGVLQDWLHNAYQAEDAAEERILDALSARIGAKAEALATTVEAVAATGDGGRGPGARRGQPRA